MSWLQASMGSSAGDLGMIGAWVSSDQAERSTGEFEDIHKSRPYTTSIYIPGWMMTHHHGYHVPRNILYIYTYIYISMYIISYNIPTVFPKFTDAPGLESLQAGAPRDARGARGHGGRAPGPRGGAELPRRAQRDGLLGRAECCLGDIFGGRWRNLSFLVVFFHDCPGE